MRYLLFNKPYGVLTQFTDSAPNSGRGPRETLKSYIDIPNVYPVGRLDLDSEGLLLLTDDGPLAARLIHPQYGHERTYWAQVEGIPTDTALRHLCGGVRIKGYQTRPAQVRLISAPALPERSVPIRYRQSIPTRWLELKLTEGKNRQVRRMTAAVGFPTLRLVRVNIAFLTLEGLEPGQWRDLSGEEIRTLRKRVGIEIATGKSRRRVGRTEGRDRRRSGGHRTRPKR